MGILDLIFPKNCLECSKEGKYICNDCLKKVAKGGWHNETYSIFKYEGVLRKAIIALKYKYTTEIAKELAEICAQNLKHLNPISNNYLLIPIPLYWYRQNTRGFNQSGEVGSLIAKEMGWKYEPNLLIKNRNTKPQVGLKGGVRRQNLSGVFNINPNFVLNTNSSVLVFDDVFTTGSTLNEAKKVLENSGFKKVWGLTIAR